MLIYFLYIFWSQQGLWISHLQWIIFPNRQMALPSVWSWCTASSSLRGKNIKISSIPPRSHFLLIAVIFLLLLLLLLLFIIFLILHHSQNHSRHHRLHSRVPWSKQHFFRPLNDDCLANTGRKKAKLYYTSFHIISLDFVWITIHRAIHHHHHPKSPFFVRWMITFLANTGRKKGPPTRLFAFSIVR